MGPKMAGKQTNLPSFKSLSSYHEMCFHTLSVSITQKTIEIVGIEFWSQRGGVGGSTSDPSKRHDLSV